MDRVREVLNLPRLEARNRRRLGRMLLLEERPDGASVAVVEHYLGAHQVGAVIGPASVRTVAVDALGGI